MRLQIRNPIQDLAHTKYGRGDSFTLTVDAVNITALQAIVDTDTGKKFTLEVGNCFVFSENDYGQIHSNSMMGYGFGGTEVLAICC